MSQVVDELYWDPFDEEIDSNPYDVWRRMRDEAPLYRNDDHDFYALTRFADVERAHKDPVTFSSAHSTGLEFMGPEPMINAEMMMLGRWGSLSRFDSSWLCTKCSSPGSNGSNAICVTRERMSRAPSRTAS